MASNTLAGARILIVEDEYFLADDARSILAEVGASVIGPVPTAAKASALIQSDQQIDCALLDVNLRGEMAFDVADALQARSIPFAFVTGYDRTALPERFADVPSMGKPSDPAELVELFVQLTATPHVG